MKKYALLALLFCTQTWAAGPSENGLTLDEAKVIAANASPIIMQIQNNASIGVGVCNENTGAKELFGAPGVITCFVITAYSNEGAAALEVLYPQGRKVQFMNSKGQVKDTYFVVRSMSIPVAQ